MKIAVLFLYQTDSELASQHYDVTCVGSLLMISPESEHDPLAHGEIRRVAVRALG